MRQIETTMDRTPTEALVHQRIPRREEFEAVVKEQQVLTPEDTGSLEDLLPELLVKQASRSEQED